MNTTLNFYIKVSICDLCKKTICHTAKYTKTNDNLSRPADAALTSLSLEQFDALLPFFEYKWEDFIEKFNLDGTPPMRKFIPKNETQLPTVAHKVFFILFYQKTNSLQEVAASYLI